MYMVFLEGIRESAEDELNSHDNCSYFFFELCMSMLSTLLQVV